MSRSLNKVMLIGNLTQDPEVRQTPGGASVCTIAIATNRQWTDQNGDKQEKAEFHNVVLWRGLADIAGKYLAKGRRVYVEGRLETRSWDGPDGQKKYKTEVVGDNMIMLDGKGQSDSSDGGNTVGNSYENTGGNATPPSINDLPEGTFIPASELKRPENNTYATPQDSSPDVNSEDEINIDEIPF